MSIPAEKIAEVRDRADIERIVGRSVRLARRGKRLVGLCPFHSEKTPSFGVDREKKLFHCFGCQAGGDVFDFVMRMEGVDFIEALRLIAHEVGVQIVDEEEDPRARELRERRERLYGVNEVAAVFYEHQLERDEHARRYLVEERGLTPETIAAFRLGWAPPGFEALTRHLDKKRVDVRLAYAVGLLASRESDGSPYDRLRGRVIFPITLPTGQLAGFGARRADWIDKEAPKYLNSPESPVYDKSSILYGLREAKDQIRKNRRAILVEGYLDVIGLHQAGVKEAIASCGTALSARHTAMLRRLTPEVVTLYDGDAAGHDAARKASELLLAEGLSVRIASLPDGEDPDTFARGHGQAGVRELLDRAPSALDFFVTQAKNAYSGGGIAGMAKAVDSVKPLLLAVKDPLERDVCLDAAAKTLGLEPAMLRRHLAAPRGPHGQGQPQGPGRRRPDDPAARGPQSSGRQGPEAPAPNAGRPGPQPGGRPGPQPPPARPLGPAPVWELAILKMFLEETDKVLEALETQEAVRAFTHPVVQAVIDAGIEALRAGKSFDGPRALEAAAEAGADPATLGVLRKTLLDSLPEPEDLAVCVKRLLRNKNTIRLQQLRLQLAKETDPDAAAQLAVEADRLSRLMASLS